MKLAAIGVRAHSGWGALVAIGGDAGDERVLARDRIVIMDPKMPGARQPYHYAREMDLPRAAKHIEQCAATSARMAVAAVREVAQRLRNAGCEIVGGAVLLGSGRPLPSLEKILASHPMLHTAEGIFFREAFRTALERLEIPVTGIPERQIEERIRAASGRSASGLQKRIAGLGRSVGPPWAQDQKLAALAATVVLAESARGTKS
jgi:hypothetical protein